MHPGELPDVQEAPAAGPVLLRGQGQLATRRSSRRCSTKARASTSPPTTSSCRSTSTSGTSRRRTRSVFIWDKIIFSNTIKDRDTLAKIKQYKPLVTFDNSDELKKIKRALRHGRPGAAAEGPGHRLAGRDELQVRRGAGRRPAADPAGVRLGLAVEGLSFHVGSQCTNFDNYTVALDIAATIFNDARKKGYPAEPRRYRRRVPRALRRRSVPQFEKLAAILNAEFDAAVPGGHRDHRRAGPVHRGHRRRRWSRRSSARRGGTARSSTTSTTASTTPSPASSTTTGSRISTPSRTGEAEICAVVGPDLRQLRQDLALRASSRGTSRSETTSTRRTSAPTAPPRRRSSTASTARRSST